MQCAYRNVTSNQISDASCFYLQPRSSLSLLHLDKKLWTEEFALQVFSTANVIRMCRGEKRLHATFQVASVESRKGSHPYMAHLRIFHTIMLSNLDHLLYRVDCNKTIVKKTSLSHFSTTIIIYLILPISIL